MTTPWVPTFEDFVRPLAGGADSLPAATPLSQLSAGDYAVLAWLDEVQARLPPGVEADIIARWDTASLGDIYAMVVAGVSGDPSP
jgi:hypothetical protein